MNTGYLLCQLCVSLLLTASLPWDDRILPSSQMEKLRPSVSVNLVKVLIAGRGPCFENKGFFSVSFQCVKFRVALPYSAQHRAKHYQVNCQGWLFLPLEYCASLLSLFSCPNHWAEPSVSSLLKYVRKSLGLFWEESAGSWITGLLYFSTWMQVLGVTETMGGRVVRSRVTLRWSCEEKNQLC